MVPHFRTPIFHNGYFIGAVIFWSGKGDTFLRSSANPKDCHRRLLASKSSPIVYRNDQSIRPLIVGINLPKGVCRVVGIELPREVCRTPCRQRGTIPVVQKVLIQPIFIRATRHSAL
jgi:hypothetical protein